MNILELKRTALGGVYRMPRQGDAGDGSGTSNNGTNGSGGAASHGSGNDHWSNLDLGQFEYQAPQVYNPFTGQMESADTPGAFQTGLNPSDYGITDLDNTITQSVLAPPSLKPWTDKLPTTQLQNAESTEASGKVKAFFESGWGKLIRMLPGGGALENGAQLIAHATDALTPREMSTFYSATGLTPEDGVAAKEAVAKGTEANFDQRIAPRLSGGGGAAAATAAELSAGPQRPQGGAPTAPAAGPMDDIFAHFTGGDSQFKMPELAAYDADPSGLIAGGKSFGDYHAREFEPYERKLRQEVDRLGSPEYLAQQRGQAMAGVQHQYDNTMRQNARDMARMGIAPNSGRAAALSQQGAIQSAAAKVGAAAQAEGLVRKDYLGGLGAVHSAGMDISKAGQGWAALGADAAKTKMGYGLGAAEFGLKGQQTGLDNTYKWGTLAADKYRVDKSAANGVNIAAMNNSALSDRQRDSDRNGMFGLVAQSILKMPRVNFFGDEEREGEPS